MTTFTLHNARGMRVAIDAHDASLRSWWAPDRYGRTADVVAGVSLPLPALTGWQGNMPDDASLLLYLSQHAVSARLHYRLGDDGSLHLDCEATAQADTSFWLPAPMFNLQGRCTSVADHVLRLAAGRYGSAGRLWEEPRDVAGSAFDFRQPAPLGARLAWPALAGMAGFDHDFFRDEDDRLREAAHVADPASGRVLRFSSTQAAFHLRTDARCFSCATQSLALLSGQAAGLASIYRLGVQDMDAFDISEPVSMMLNK